MPGRGRRIVSFLLCLCMIAPFLSDFSGWVLSSVAEETAYATNRKADPNTMDDYLKQLLSTDWGSRYAGRIWTDKSVLAFGQEGITNWSKMNDQWQLALDMATDGFEGIVGSKADFLHIFSALASSQQLSGVPPVRTVIVFDNSGSMYNSSSTAASSGEELWQRQRIAITIESINRAIDLLMEASVYNEVSVVLFGDGTQTDRSDTSNTHVYHGNNTAVTILPMKHYKPQKTVVDGKETYTPYLKGGWNNSNVKTSFDGESPCHQGTGTDGKSGPIGGGWVFVNNEICGLKAKEAEGEDWNDKGYNDCGSLAYTGYANGTTNIQAGYYVGLQELLKADKTVKIGTDIYQCVPSLVMLTDGAATDKMSGTFITPKLAENSTHLSSMGFVNDTGNKLRSFTGYSTDVNKQKEIQNFWDMFVEIADNGKYESPVKGQDYSKTLPYNPIGNGLLAMKEVADTYSDSVASMLLGTLMTTAYYKAAVRKAYGIADNEDWNIYSLSVDMVDMHEVPKDAANIAKGDGSNTEPKEELPLKWQYDITSNAPTMDPAEYFVNKDGNVDLKWLLEKGYLDEGVDLAEALEDPDLVLTHTAYPDYSVGEMIIHGIVKAGYYLNQWAKDETTDPLTTKFQSWQESKNIFKSNNWNLENKANPYSHGNGYLLEEKQTVSWPQVDPNNAEKVTKQDVLGNIGYNNFAYYAKTSDDAADDLADKFQAIIDAIAEPLFIPVEGNNAAGVGNSITYQDPLGEYMEIKNEAITAQAHKDTSAQSYDMALLLFGEMHGLVRAGVYDYQWNNKWMTLNADGETIIPDETPFPMGWYKGEPKKDQKALTKDQLNEDTDGSSTYPARDPETGKVYKSAQEARNDGWVYRFNFETLLQFVPIVDAPEDNLPGKLSEQAKNTVYTCYRFAGSQADRNALRRNPIFGAVPNDLQNSWAKYEATGNYPAGNSEYAETPGVYRLSDIRVWLEDYGDYTDSTGAITPNQGYDRSLYLNVPAAAVPTQLATVTLGPDGVLSYETNLGDDHEIGSKYGKDEDGNPITVNEAMQNAFYAQSTPLRLFYAVGLEEDLILRDEETDEQIGVDFTKISPEYIQSHTVEGQNYVWFLSNYYSNTTYDEYVTDTATSSTRGDPTVTFSPNADNRYYVFQKPLPLYAHAYRNTADGLKAVDNTNGVGWAVTDNQKGGNGKTTWETTKEGQQLPGSWVGGEYMGTYDNEESFKSAVERMKASTTDTTHITDDHGNTYLYVEDGIIFLEADVLDHVTSNSDGGYAEGSISFNSDDYYFMLVEYYLPDETTGTDQMGEELPGTHGGRMVQRVVARRGSEFGSGFASDQIDNGDMLCWTDMSGKITLELEYLSKSDTGDLTRGEPTFEKLTYNTDEQLRKYFNEKCGIDPKKTMANPDYDPKDESSPKEVNVIEYLVQYWLDVQKDSKVQAALEEAREKAGSDGLTAENFNNYFQFAVSARKGGIRSGDMANNRHAKTMQDTEGNTVSGNVTNTAENYYVPTVSDNSATDNGVILNTYLGNNGYLEVANQMLHVTKLLEAPEGYTLSQAAYDEEFNFQVYVQGVSGKRSAILTEYNEFSKSWDRQLAYIDVLTDNSDLVVDNDSNRALFVKSTVKGTQGVTLTAKQVIAQTDEAGDPVYYEANEDGTLPTKDDGSLDESKIVKITTENPLYYLYLPSNGDSETAKHTRRLYQNGRYGGAADGYASTNFIKNGTTTFYAEGQGEDTGVKPGVGNNDSYRQTNDEVKRPAGTITYWAQDAELIPVSEVQAAETVDSILSGEPSAYAAEAVDSTPGVWTHNAESEGHKTDHVALTFFTFVIRRPADETSMTAFESPFKTRSSYMTVDLVFGQNANEKDGGTGTGDLGANDLYDTVIPSADRSDLFGDEDGKVRDPADPTKVVVEQLDNDYIAAHTAEFTLKHGEGLLLSGLDNRIPYRFTEKLTPDQLAKGYTLKQINHIQQRDSDTVYMPGVQEIPVDTSLEPFAHTNAVLWESYATMTNTGNHHDPENNPSCGKSLADGGCDEQVDGSTRHYFYYGGKLVDPHYEGEGATSRYVLNPTAHFGTLGETQESTATTSAQLPADGYYKYNGVYSVYGNTGYFEEQANYVNTVSPDMLALTKELVDESGTTLTTAAEIPFTFTLELTPDTSVMTNTAGKLYYWVGSIEQLKQFPEEGGPPLLSEYQSYINEDGTSESLKVLTPDEGSTNKYTVTFNAGQAVVIYGLINGTKYTVKEVEQANYPAYQDYYSYSGKIVHLQPVDPEPGVTPYAEMIPNRTVNREGFKNRIITGSLTVEKRIDETETEPDDSMEFTFTLTLTEKPGAADVEKLSKDKLTVTKYKSSGEPYDSSEYSSTWVDSTEGTLTLTFTLKHKEKITVDGIPMDTAFEVKEIGRKGYDLKSVVHVNADGSDGAEYEVANDAVNDTVTATQNPDVRFINVQPPLLPFTGGIGVGVFYLLGFALLLASGAFYVGICKKRRAGEK